MQQNFVFAGMCSLPHGAGTTHTSPREEAISTHTRATIRVDAAHTHTHTQKSSSTHTHTHRKAAVHTHKGPVYMPRG